MTLTLLLLDNLQEFVASDPLLSEFKSEILSYQKLAEEIENISPTFRVGHGAIELYSGKLHVVKLTSASLINKFVVASSRC